MRQYGETYLPDQYVIHDPSRVVAAGDYGLMVAVTGKEQGGNNNTQYLIFMLKFSDYRNNLTIM